MGGERGRDGGVVQFIWQSEVFSLPSPAPFESGTRSSNGLRRRTEGEEQG